MSVQLHSFQDFQPMWSTPDPPTLQTDGWTDVKQSQIAIRNIVHRAVKIYLLTITGTCRFESTRMRYYWLISHKWHSATGNAQSLEGCKCNAWWQPDRLTGCWRLFTLLEYWWSRAFVVIAGNAKLLDVDIRSDW